MWGREVVFRTVSILRLKNGLLCCVSQREKYLSLMLIEVSGHCCKQQKIVESNENWSLRTIKQIFWGRFQTIFGFVREKWHQITNPFVQIDLRKWHNVALKHEGVSIVSIWWLGNYLSSQNISEERRLACSDASTGSVSNFRCNGMSVQNVTKSMLLCPFLPPSSRSACPKVEVLVKASALKKPWLLKRLLGK